MNAFYSSSKRKPASLSHGLSGAVWGFLRHSNLMQMLLALNTVSGIEGQGRMVGLEENSFHVPGLKNLLGEKHHVCSGDNLHGGVSVSPANHITYPRVEGKCQQPDCFRWLLTGRNWVPCQNCPVFLELLQKISWKDLCLRVDPVGG